MSPEDEQVREVYARFGLAIYAAQCLEHGLVDALMYLDLIPSVKVKMEQKEWERAVDDFTSQHFEHTLGRLIRDISRFTQVPTSLSDLLSRALTMRNWLAHDYFRERAENFMFNEGRVSMIVELQDAVDLLRGADAQLSSLLEPLLIKYGVTEALITKVENEMLSEAKRSFSSFQ